MNTSSESTSATQLFKQDCRERKITQKDLAATFGVSELTINRMLNQESNKLEEAFRLISHVTALTGKMAFQYADIPLSRQPKLSLIDQVTQMTDEEADAIQIFLELLRRSDSKGNRLFSPHLQYEAFNLLSQVYPKILKANLSDDSFTIIQCRNEEWDYDDVHAPTHLSQWIKQVGHSELIHPEDRQKFIESTGLYALRMYLRKSDRPYTLTYRRRFGHTYKWVSMLLKKSVEYTNQNQVIFLCLVDIHHLYQDIMQECHQRS